MQDFGPLSQGFLNFLGTESGIRSLGLSYSLTLSSVLATENFEVVTASDGESACSKFFSDTFSLVLLDLMIPKVSGIDVMQHIRRSSVVPILIVSAKDSESDKTLGLGLGENRPLS